MTTLLAIYVGVTGVYWWWLCEGYTERHGRVDDFPLFRLGLAACRWPWDACVVAYRTSPPVARLVDRLAAWSRRMVS